MAQYLDYAGLSLYDKLIKELIKNNQTEVLSKLNDILGGSDVDLTISEINELIEGIQADLDNKVDTRIETTAGVAEIFNEADGGGAHYTAADGSEAFVGVNGDGADGMMAQIYADVPDGNGGWSGSRINVYNDGIYYQSKDATDEGIPRNAPSREIAVKGDIDDLREILNTITGADSDSIASITELKAAIEANSDAIDELLGDGENSIDNKIDTKVDEAITNLVNGAPEALDTLREIVEWIGGSDVDGVNIAENLAKNANDIQQNADDIDALETQVQQNAEDIANANDAYNVATSRIDALEEIIGLNGSDSDNGNIIDRVSDIEDRLVNIREEEDTPIEKTDIRGLFTTEINNKVVED